MNETNLLELKKNFQRGIVKYATANYDEFENVWTKLVNIHKDRPYHNLSLAYQDLDTARRLKMYIPEQVIVAAVLRYGSFSVYAEHNATEAADWSAMFLRHAFGWPETEISVVKTLITAGGMLTPPTESCHYYEKLMHDMKKARFAKETEFFLKDRQKIRIEFKNLDDYRYFCSEQALLMNYYHSPTTFVLPPFQIMTGQVKDNIYHRLTWVTETLKKHFQEARKKS